VCARSVGNTPAGAVHLSSTEVLLAPITGSPSGTVGRTPLAPLESAERRFGSPPSDPWRPNSVDQWIAASPIGRVTRCLLALVAWPGTAPMLRVELGYDLQVGDNSHTNPGILCCYQILDRATLMISS
jgi:hypothetical protein